MTFNEAREAFLRRREAAEDVLIKKLTIGPDTIPASDDFTVVYRQTELAKAMVQRINESVSDFCRYCGATVPPITGEGTCGVCNTKKEIITMLIVLNHIAGVGGRSSRTPAVPGALLLRSKSTRPK